MWFYSDMTSTQTTQTATHTTQIAREAMWALYLHSVRFDNGAVNSPTADRETTNEVTISVGSRTYVVGTLDWDGIDWVATDIEGNVVATEIGATDAASFLLL